MRFQALLPLYYLCLDEAVFFIHTFNDMPSRMFPLWYAFAVFYTRVLHEWAWPHAHKHDNLNLPNLLKIALQGVNYTAA